MTLTPEQLRIIIVCLLRTISDWQEHERSCEEDGDGLGVLVWQENIRDALGVRELIRKEQGAAKCN